MIILTLAWAYAANFSGYETPGQKQMSEIQHTEIKGVVQKILQSSTDYLIQIGEYAALYRFPKEKDPKGVLLKILETSKAKKVILVLKIDPLTAKVLTVSELKK